MQFTNCISIINIKQVDDAHNTDVIAIFNLTEYSDNYSKISATLWQYCVDAL